MMYTVRYCHLQGPGYLNVGGSVPPGAAIGKMGNTGASQGDHLHIDCVHGCHVSPWHLSDMEEGKVKPAYRQINYFIDKDLFDYPIVTTTAFNDIDYMITTGKVHLSYDVVPEDRRKTKDHYVVYWNRSFQGTVIANDYDDGYGYYVHISFNA